MRKEAGTLTKHEEQLDAHGITEAQALILDRAAEAHYEAALAAQAPWLAPNRGRKRPHRPDPEALDRKR